MDVKLPKLGEGADSGTVVSLLVKEGDRIELNQTLLELENEKAVAPIPSTVAGVITKIHVKEGDKLSVGQRILTVAASPRGINGAPTAEDEPTVIQRGGGQAEARPAVSAEEEPPSKPETPEAAEDRRQTTKDRSQTSGLRLPTSDLPAAASPSVRQAARELGIDLTRVRGSERGGRIGMADLRAYVQRLQKLTAQPKPSAAPAQKATAEVVDFSKWGEISKKPMSSLRKVISRRMAENWNTIPHVTQFDDADITALLELRKKYAPAYEQKGARLTLTPFALKAVVATLKKHPSFNASLDEAAGEVLLKEYYHIGVAVDTEAGLIVPVIRDVDKKSLLDLSKELEALAQKARDRKVSLDELKGGTFTISNQGGIGGSHFTPIINKPEVAILGLGRGVLKPVVKDKQIVPRMMLPIGLSYDHRVIDGGTAARFTVDLVQALENFAEADVKI
ncbi:MAG: 2-oxo acid dehydrogenase subunit E2 [Verrucomicrobia bacterium]|nr:2-oxo acid dehydrogenase subunit E2 [Verrucomicrobiota bacterium]